MQEELDAALAMIRSAQAADTPAAVQADATLAIVHLLAYFALDHKTAR